MKRERLANTWEEAERVLRILRDCDEFTYDTETSGLDWRHNHPVGYVLTFRDENSYYVPVRHAGGGNLPGCSVPMTPDGWRGDLHPFEIEFAKIVAERPRKVVGHNLVFDLRFSARASIFFYGDFEDTGVNAPLLDENQFSYSLSNCAKREGVQEKKGEPLYEFMAKCFGGEPERGQMGNFWRTNAADPVVWEDVRLSALRQIDGRTGNWARATTLPSLPSSTNCPPLRVAPPYNVTGFVPTESLVVVKLYRWIRMASGGFTTRSWLVLAPP